MARSPRSQRAAAALVAFLVCTAACFAAAADPAPSTQPAASGAAAGTGAAAGSGDSPTAAALAQLLSGLSRLAQSLPKSSPPAPAAKVEAPKPAPVVPAPEQPAMNPNVTQRVFNPNAKTFMEQFVKNGTCNQTMLPNGDFETDEHEAYRITNWIKIKEKGANGGGIVGNGSDPGATGWPGYPFDNKNQYFKTQAFGNVGFGLVNQYAIEVNSTRQILYFDWFMDNAFDYWLVPDTMSIHANASNVTLHAARVDLYDYDKLEPAGNITQLAQYLFDPTNATAGPAYLGPALTVPDIVAFGNLQSVGSYVPLAPYIGKRVLVVFRYATTVYYMTWGLDNVSVVTCDDSLGFYTRHHKRRLM